jgi:hypothetical protein
MNLAWRLRESLAAVVLVGVRLHFRPNPFDWIVLLGTIWALLPLSVAPPYRRAVLGFGAVALAALYLHTQAPNMLATSNLLP